MLSLAQLLESADTPKSLAATGYTIPLLLPPTCFSFSSYIIHHHHQSLFCAFAVRYLVVSTASASAVNHIERHNLARIVTSSPLSHLEFSAATSRDYSIGSERSSPLQPWYIMHLLLSLHLDLFLFLNHRHRSVFSLLLLAALFNSLPRSGP